MANQTVYPYGTDGELPSSIGLINDLTTGGSDKALAAQQGVVIGNIIRPKEIVNIPFDGGNYYIKSSSDGQGDRTYNASWIATQYIPVQEGDVFYYSGHPGTASFAVAGYIYDGTTYTYSINLLGTLNTTAQYIDKFIYIPSGITHILVSSRTSADSYSLTRVVHSTLSKMQEDLGVLSSVEQFKYSDFTVGYYVRSNGVWTASSNYRYLLVDVIVGDSIELYDFQVSSTSVAVFAKKITDTTFEPLYIPENQGIYNKITYTVSEAMTICISVINVAGGNPRLCLLRYNRLAKLETTENLLTVTRTEIATTNNERQIIDIELGFLFNKIAVIGDSMAVATMDNYNPPKSASWLSLLAKRWDCIAKEHFAKGGASAYSWLNSSEFGLGKMLSDPTIYNAYFIAYGHNDSATEGSASDTAAPVTITESGGAYTTSCPDGYSFCAYYKAIIDQIRTKAPHAMIFCLSEYDGVMVNSKPTYRQAVINVAEAYYNGGDTLVHHLETGGVSGGGGGMGLGSHYSTIGYAYIAKRVNDEVNKIIYQYRSDSAIKTFGVYNL